MKMSKNNSKDS